jgi:hypothetical protein
MYIRHTSHASPISPPWTENSTIIWEQKCWVSYAWKIKWCEVHAVMFSLPIVRWPSLTLRPTLHHKRSISSIMSSGVNRPEREFNNSHLSINEVNNERVCTFASAFMAWTGTNFTIFLCLKIQRITRKVSEPVCRNLCFIFTVLNTKKI